MAASLLEANLRFLHESLAGDSAKKEQASSIVSDLNQICIQEVTNKEIDFTCSCLFDKDYGLLRFLNKAVTNDELQVCKTRVLEFLSEFLQKVEKKILPYAVEIKDVCVSIFSRDKYARVKNAAMPLLIKLLELTAGSSLGDKLEIDKLVTKLFESLTKAASKLSNTVREKIYLLLGVIAEVYPEYMTPYAERLTGIYLTVLKTEMNSKTRKPELSLIAGCLEGLNCSLVHFTESADEGSKNSYEIFKYARSSIDPKIELTRYAMPQGGLKLFARHAAQFSQYLVEDYENMYSKLSYWSHHKNYEMMLLGLRATEAFMTQICEMLKEKSREGAEKGGGIFKYFVRQFREIMHNEKATSKELSLAVKGYGLLAAPCRCYLKQEDVQFMFVEMLTKTEQMFTGQVEDMDNKLYNLASYLESLASIVREMSSLSDAYSHSLDQLMVLLMENLPNIPRKTHFLCQRSILLVLLAVMPKATAFKQILSGFVYQSLIRTCSYTPVIEMETQGEATTDDPLQHKVTYKDFMHMWSGLLDAPSMKEFGALDISLETRHQLTDAIYNEIITAVLKILDKLDLTSDPALTEDDADVSAQLDDSLATSADPVLGVQASKPKDFQIFINLVDFCRDLLPVKHYEKFECWLFPFSHKLILMSTDNPLASGFYKLLSICMKISSKLSFFENVKTDDMVDIKAECSEVKQESMDTDTAPSTHTALTYTVPCTQRHTCFLLIKKFSKEVLVRMKQYRDELLASCLAFILALPKEIISDQMLDVVPAIQVTLKLGLSYLPLAMVAMDALELWSRSLPAHVMKKHYTDILPALDSYLKTADQGAEEVNVDAAVSMNKSKSGKGRKKLPIRLVKGVKNPANESYQSQLAQVKQRIMRYLGRLGGSVNTALLANADVDIAKTAIAWDNIQHLKFDMPFIDMKPTIYLDPFLPRVTELALTSSDRQTKVAACELLHSLVLYTIGRGAMQPGERAKRVSMVMLLKKIFPAMLKLACDIELVARQLFEPLTMQLIHWFTGSKRTESDETMALLDAIYNGMIQQSDTALRDFCAKCLHEFLKWAIKQTGTKMAENNPANAKSVFKRLYSYSLHPCPFKRVGAALAFNNIYMVFREEEPLVNMFTFELLVHFVESLAIAHADEKSLGSQEQCCKALEHLEKIMKHKAPLLRAPHKLRTHPKNWSALTLEICVRWLTRQCGRPQTECRHACMKLSYQLTPLLAGVKTPVKFFQACLKGKGPEYWIQRFEGGGYAGSVKYGIEGAPLLTDKSTEFSLQSTLDWFDNVLAALDCYTWVFGENLLSPQELFGTKTSDGSQSHIFKSVQYFVTKVALVDISELCKLFPGKSQLQFFTPKERDDFSRAKCTVVVRLFAFFTIMLAKYRKETLAVVPKWMWCEELWELMCCCVLKPADVGFNLGDVEIMKNLPHEMSQTLTVFNMAFRTDMLKHFTVLLKGDRNILSQLPIDYHDAGTDHVHIQQVMAGYLQLHQVDLLLPCLPGNSRTKCAGDLLDNVFTGLVSESFGNVSPVTLTPTAQAVAKVMLKLALALGIKTGTLLEKIFDNTRVYCGSQKDSEQLHGDLFFLTFKGTISHHCIFPELISQLVKRIETESSRVCAVLMAAVDTVTKNRDLRKKEGGTVLAEVLGQWPSLSKWWGKQSNAETQSMALGLLTKLMLIDSKFASSPESKSFSHVFSMYQSMLTDTQTNLSFKCRVLDLLPFFANVPDPYTAQLKSSLDRFVADNFPLRSSELIKGSPQYINYIAALDKILAGFQLSGSIMLLEYLISIFCREPVHAHEDAIQAALAKFIKRLGRDKQKSGLDVPFNIFVKSSSLPAETRRAVIERVCLSMFRLVHKSVAIDFFTDHIGKIKELIEVRLARSSEAVLEGQLITRMGCFQLLETMYSRLSKDELVGPTSAINKAFCGGNVQSGKELTKFISTHAHDAKGEDIRGESTLLELRRQYHCVAHNLMIAFISTTQTDIKYYTAFLFEEKEAKGQFLLENFIDKDRTYEFQAELMSPMERKKKFVSIHQEVKENRHGNEEDSYDDVTPSYHLASQYLADSSLSEDVSQYYTLSAAAGSLSSSSGRGGKVKSSTSVDEVQVEVEVTVESDYVELEMDGLNQHECMATMIALVKHMQQASITPPLPTGTSEPAMPSWMVKLHSKMTNTRTHFNIKLFMAKLIMNTAKVFEAYACHWLQPLMQLIVTGPLGNGTINYFIVDLVVTLLSWHKVAIPKDTAEDSSLASRLVHFIVKNIYHDNRQVFRNNLEMLKTLLECWKGRIQIPYQEIYGQFINPDMKAKDNTVGIQVLGVVIACKYPPYGPTAPVDRERYYSKFANNLGHSSKTIHAPAAEVCGMIFQHLADKEGETDGTFHSHVSNLMKNLHQSRPDTFITVVHRMHKHYPTIADRFVNKLLFMLPNLYGEFRTLCLEVLHTRIDGIENAYMELKSKGLMTALSHRDEATQQISLKIVKSILAKLKSSELSVFMPLVTAFGSNPSTGCRNIMYDILMWVYDNYRDEDTEEANKIIVQTKECLLRGLADEDLHCRLQVQNFWSSETRLPVETLDRLVAMLEAMYSPVTEQEYLSYTTNLILEMTSKSPDYQKEIFEHPLSECKFSDYAVKSSWRHRHAAMTPLFATQSSQTQMEVDESVDGGVRATQDIQQFTQTQQTGIPKGPFNWLTQSSLDTFAEASSTFPMETQSTLSTLLFNVGSGDGRASSARRPKPGPGFGQQKIAPKQATSSAKKEGVEDDNELFRLKRRFMKDQEQSRVYFAKRNTRIKNMREVAQREQKAKRESQVTMYRKYRSGDLPDIQIKYSYLIAPLQALAHRDSTVAKLLLSAIFEAIFENRDEVKTEREINEVTQQINTSLDNVLAASTQYYPPFIGCVLDILYKLRKYLKVENVSNVGAGAIFSNLQPLGIAVLEEQLILHEPADARAAKRSRMQAPVSDDVSHWIELSRLYKSLNEYDVLLGIFRGKIGTKSITQKAVETEAKGDYSAARKLYDEAMHCTEWPEGNPLDVEIDLWEECHMECLSRLTQWDALESQALEPLTEEGSRQDMAKIWTDTYLQEHFLPYIMKSKVKLLLHGDENQQELLKFIDASMKVTEHRLVLEGGYSCELALMYVWQENYDRARHYCNTALDCFLQEWSSTDTLMTGSRAAVLHRLQPLTELQEFLSFVGEEDDFQTPVRAKALVNSWNKRTPHYLTDPVTIWDDVVTNRTVYLDQISSRLQKLDHSQNTEDVYQDMKLRLKLKMAESCREQNNFALTLKILKETSSECKRSSSDSVVCTWTHLYASTHHRKIHTALQPASQDSLNSVFTTLDQLGKIEENEALTAIPSLGRRHHVLCADALELLSLGIQSQDMPELEGSRLGQKLLDYTGLHKLTLLELTEKLVSDGYQKMKASIAVEDIAGHEETDVYGQHQAYLATAKYCDNILRLHEDDELKVGSKCLKAFPETVVICILRAMKLDSTEARQRFPRLLQIVEQYPDVLATFVAKSGEVPCWMFMLWISQMLAILDKSEALAVHHILLEIAQNYPQAVIYSMKLSQEGYNFGHTKQDKLNKDMLNKIMALLGPDRMPLVDKFVSALECFGQPDQDIKESLEEMSKLLRKNKRSQVKEMYMQFYHRIIDYKNREQLERNPIKSQKSGAGGQTGSAATEPDESFLSSQTGLDIGSYARKFADKFKKEFDKRFGVDGIKLDKMSPKEFGTHRSELNGLFGAELDARKGGSLVPPDKLADYSKWMSDFSQNIHKSSLEIPGQYMGLCKPLPEYHVKVAGFGQSVKVMTSLRKPKCVTIHGNDEKDYLYLVKGGEDLRQDQRIEQLFYIMNQVFRKDPACRNRKLELKTYQVIPMTLRVGLIEWVNDTMPLKDFIVNSLTDAERKAYSSGQGPNPVQWAWIKKVTPEKDHNNNNILFANVYKKYSYTETVKQLAIVEGKVPWDLLRRSFQNMSTSPEAFHVLRSHCMKTHAMLSISQYIIGIGDRHLSNFMLNMCTGEMVGIDFGHAFGSATQFIGVPELMPFRLTRQLRNLMLPLQTNGLIESTMTHVLRALRSNSDLLLNTMDIFLKEPSLDWKQNAERLATAMRDEDVELYSQEESILEWYPKEKIRYVKRKLRGDNPSRITRDELYLGHGKKKEFKDFELVVLGHNQNPRAKLPSHDLSVEQQVTALIDQATDPNILGRTWLGWEPWV